ncbi:MAG: cyclodeaminase/cyclohydrolase family protein [Gracilibacteraceae bacterium]|jgi:formiminotetrahydrofolate cyclodeaminase|nr:cyclodeaminase/cyclohydrolase family protein [Gracilibacteraceae bacterium]
MAQKSSSLLAADCAAFLELLASAAPVPGGGGAAALAGAAGVALGSMVANLTTGKKKYAAYENELQAILGKSAVLQEKLARLVDRDAEVFAPLSQAYGLPRATEEERRQREEVMAEALLAASIVPLEIMRCAYEALLLHEKLAVIGTRLAISDVGVGAQLLRAAIHGAAMNIFINTKSMADRERAGGLEAEADDLIARSSRLADEIYRKVEAEIR